MVRKDGLDDLFLQARRAVDAIEVGGHAAPHYDPQELVFRGVGKDIESAPIRTATSISLAQSTDGQAVTNSSTSSEKRAASAVKS